MKPRGLPQSLNGFALGMALALMSFTVLLILALATLSRVNSQAVRNVTQIERARQNALLGLRIALGQLQKHAGPDQRVTARAEIGDDPATREHEVAHPYWTGVWDAMALDSPPVWLVSGYAPNPWSTPRDVRLVGNPSAGADRKRYVYAPRVAIPSFATPGSSEVSPTGHYAYWVSDEGVKASAGLVDRIAYLSSPAYEVVQRQRLRHLSARRFGLETLFGYDVNLKPLDPRRGLVGEGGLTQTAVDVLKVTAFSQLALIPGITAAEAQEAVFAVTPLTLGVLADTEHGGLKKDLSDPEFRDPDGPIPIDTTVHEFLRQRADAKDTIPLRGIDAGLYDAQERGFPNMAEGTPLFTTPVVLCELALYVGVFKASDESDSHYLSVALMVDQWTPYSLPLAFKGGATPDVKIRFHHLPKVTVDSYTEAEDAPGVFTYQGQSAVIDFSTKPVEFLLNLSDTMKGGEVRTPTRLQFPEEAMEWVWTLVRPENGRGFFRYTLEASTVDIEVLDMQDNVLQVFKKVPWGGVTADDFLIKEAGVAEKVGAIQAADYPLRFWLRFDDEVLPNLQKWASVLDPREPIIDFEDTDTDRRELIHSLFVVHEVDSIEEDFRREDFRREDFFSGYNFKKNYYRLFDVPTQEPISVGVLRHMGCYQEPPLAIGNSWGGERNAVFDRYYLSTIPRQGESIWTPHQRDEGVLPGLGFEPLPNTRLIVYDPDKALTLDALRTEDAAPHLLVAGAFNLNSTSVDAWKSVLSGNSIQTWTYRNTDGHLRERGKLQNAFFRLPFGADRHFSRKRSGEEVLKYPAEEYPNYPELSTTARAEWFQLRIEPHFGAAWNLGVRELSEGQVANLADRIVEALQERGRPFQSIRALLNAADGTSEGLLQKAIDQTDINTLSSGQTYENAPESARFPRHATAFLSQSDIVSALAPFLSARSDTFRIRAYGDAYNPATGDLEGRAWCEALVQRLPVRLDGGDPMSTAEGLGRRFHIVQFQWLSPQTI